MIMLEGLDGVTGKGHKAIGSEGLPILLTYQIQKVNGNKYFMRMKGNLCSRSGVPVPKPKNPQL